MRATLITFPFGLRVSSMVWAAIFFQRHIGGTRISFEKIVNSVNLRGVAVAKPVAHRKAIFGDLVSEFERFCEAFSNPFLLPRSGGLVCACRGSAYTVENCRESAG